MSGRSKLRWISCLFAIAAVVNAKVVGKDLAAASAEYKRKGTTLYTLSHSGQGRIPLQAIGSSWTAGVKVGPNTAPQLNINLVVPHGAPVKKAADGSTFVTLEYLVAKSKG